MKFCADFKSENRFALWWIIGWLIEIFRVNLFPEFAKKHDISHPNVISYSCSYQHGSGTIVFVSLRPLKWILYRCRNLLMNELSQADQGNWFNYCSSYLLVFTIYIWCIQIALKLSLKGSRVWENLLWHPFDDSRVFNDPCASERGLQRPLEVAS